MVEALAAQTTLAEQRPAFVEAAYIAQQEAAEYGLVYEADDGFKYLQDKLTSKRTKRPKLRSFKFEDAKSRFLRHGLSRYWAIHVFFDGGKPSLADLQELGN